MFCDVFLIRRCWQWTSLIERTFHLDNVAERFTVQWLLVVTVFLLFSKGLCPIFPLPLPFWVPGMDEAKERGPLVGSNVLGSNVVLRFEKVAMSLSVFYYCIWNFRFNTIFMSLFQGLRCLLKCYLKGLRKDPLVT